MISRSIIGQTFIGFIGRPRTFTKSTLACALDCLAKRGIDRRLDLGDPERVAARPWSATCASTRNWSRSTVLNWPMFISGTRICLKPFSRTDIFLGIGQMWRTWTWATSCPLASARRTAWWIGPKVEPQPTTASSAPSRPRQTS